MHSTQCIVQSAQGTGNREQCSGDRKQGTVLRGQETGNSTLCSGNSSAQETVHSAEETGTGVESLKFILIERFD